MKTYSIENGTVICKFTAPPVEFTAIVQRMRALKGRFLIAKKAWQFPYSEELITALIQLGFSSDSPETSATLISDIWEKLDEPQADVDESKLPSALRNYQIEAVRFMEANNWRGFVALAPRCGKTVVSLCGNFLHSFFPTIIFTTATGKAVWRREIKKWTGEDALVLSGFDPSRIPRGVKYIILNYEIATYWVAELLAIKAQYLIIDESHYIANPEGRKAYSKAEHTELIARAIERGEDPTRVAKTHVVPTQCTQAFLTLAESTPHIALLSGTPATKCPAQLQVPLSVLDPARCGDRGRFLWRYCDPKRGFRGWVFEGLSHEDELIPILNQWMFRRTKEDVFTELPEEQHEFLPFEIDYAEYNREMDAFRAWYQAQAFVSDAELEERLASFESLSYARKRGQIISWIEDFLEINPKLVVYAWHTDVVRDLYAHFRKRAVHLYGHTPTEEREELIRRFNEDGDVQLFIGQIRACSEAISLYASDTVLYAELPTTPSALKQSGERIWLPDIKRDKTFFYYAIAADTIDEKRIVVLRDRMKLLGRMYGDTVTGAEALTSELRAYLDRK